MRVIGWSPRTCHERVAVRRDGGRNQRETETERKTRGIGGAGECLEVEDAQGGAVRGEREREAERGVRESEEDLEGLRESIIGIP